MKRSTVIVMTVLAASVAMPAVAADLHLRVVTTDNGLGSIQAAPGGAVRQLPDHLIGDDVTGGLASAVFDLECAEAVLPAAEVPAMAPMNHFAPPLGTALNPFGYGGTPAPTGLVQIGGSQNVANHGRWACSGDRDCPDGASCDAGFCAPLPGMAVGEVLVGIAYPGFPETLATGSFQVPDGTATVTLRPSAVRASALVAGADGAPVWFTEPVGEGTLLPLVVTITQAQAPSIPVAAPTVLGLFAALLGGVGWLVLRRA